MAHCVPTILSFIRSDSDFNRRYIAPSAEVNTGVYEDHAVEIEDARPNRESFTLDTAGFILADHKSEVTDFHALKSDFTGRDNSDETYGGEIRELLLKLTGADKVVTFGIVVRQTKPEGSNFQPPASDVHVDWTPRRAHELAKDMIGKSDDPDFKYSSFYCINLWRAISEPPQDYPLAVCDARSLTSTTATPNYMISCDKVPNDITKRDELPKGPIVSEADLFPYDGKQKWYYFSNMTAGEILAFKLYDSTKKIGGRCPHTAFYNNSPGTHPRESVEIRSVVYFK